MNVCKQLRLPIRIFEDGIDCAIGQGHYIVAFAGVFWKFTVRALESICSFSIELLPSGIGDGRKKARSGRPRRRDFKRLGEYALEGMDNLRSL